MLAIAVDHWLGLATIVVSLAGLAMTVFSFISGRKDATRRAEEICHEKLLAEHKVTEQLSAELLELKQSRRLTP